MLDTMRAILEWMVVASLALGSIYALFWGAVFAFGFGSNLAAKNRVESAGCAVLSIASLLAFALLGLASVGSFLDLVKP